MRLFTSGGIAAAVAVTLLSAVAIQPAAAQDDAATCGTDYFSTQLSDDWKLERQNQSATGASSECVSGGAAAS